MSSLSYKKLQTPEFDFFLLKALDAVDSNAGEPAGPKARREKKDKDANKIDFSKPLDISVKELFAPLNARTGGGKKAKEKEKRVDQTLPDDMHFTSRQLVTLFLKPKFSVCSPSCYL